MSGFSASGATVAAPKDAHDNPVKLFAATRAIDPSCEAHSRHTFDAKETIHFLLKYCTARSCFSAAARVGNVPRFLRFPVFGSFLREYRRYSPDFNFLIIFDRFHFSLVNRQLTSNAHGSIMITPSNSKKRRLHPRSFAISNSVHCDFLPAQTS